jgi:hypothetical protein
MPLMSSLISFILSAGRYQPDEDQSLDMHVDECDVTFNFALTPADSFEGNDLAFCGMLGSVSHRCLVAMWGLDQLRSYVQLCSRNAGDIEHSLGH